jgi:putative PIN family toxin of toxin-antitoxin system
LRVVLDTNVLVSGLLYPERVPGRIVAAWREGRFELVLSVEQLAEIGRVLAYPKIRRILGWDDETIGRFVRQLLLRAEMVAIKGIKGAELRDAADDPILASFIAGGADLLVTGDADLLAHRDEYAIVAPAELADRL